MSDFTDLTIGDLLEQLAETDAAFITIAIKDQVTHEPVLAVIATKHPEAAKALLAITDQEWE